MLVRDVMSTDVDLVAADTTLQDAARLLSDAQGACLAVRDGGTMIGLVTLHDVVARGVAEDLRPSSTPITEIMTPSVAWVYDSAEHREAADRMKAEGHRRLLVLDEHDRVCGVLELESMVASSEATPVGVEVVRSLRTAEDESS